MTRAVPAEARQWFWEQYRLYCRTTRGFLHTKPGNKPLFRQHGCAARPIILPAVHRPLRLKQKTTSDAAVTAGRPVRCCAPQTMPTHTRGPPLIRCTLLNHRWADPAHARPQFTKFQHPYIVLLFLLTYNFHGHILGPLKKNKPDMFLCNICSISD